MSRPFKHPDTHVYYFRKVVPADVRAITGKWEVRRSLKTKNQAEARERYAKVAAEIAEEWKRLRATANAGDETSAQRVETAGTEGLSRRDALALAGEWYVWFTNQNEDEPGDDDFGWALLAEQLASFDQRVSPLLDDRNETSSVYLRGPKTQTAVHAFLTEHGRAGEFLREIGQDLSPEGLASFYAALEPQFFAAMRLLAKRAGGDYSRDAYRERFPERRTDNPTVRGATLHELFDRWAAETKPREKTRYSWRRVFDQLVSHLGHDDAAKITKADVIGWKDALIASGLSTKTVRDSKLAPLLAVIRWSVANGALANNPADGVTVTVRKTGGGRRGFNDAEARMVLAAAACETAPHLKWLPLLCALTGARLSELCQLRGADVQREGGVWFLNLTWDAGALKNRASERKVPLHSALVKRGFLEFAQGRPNGPLFAELSPDRFGNRGGTGTKRIGAWVKTHVGLDDPRISPSHSWRHRFKTLCRRHGIGADFHDAITGHAKANEGAAYGEFPLDALAREIEKLPDPLA
jgi:integrase